MRSGGQEEIFLKTDFLVISCSCSWRWLSAEESYGAEIVYIIVSE